MIQQGVELMAGKCAEERAALEALQEAYLRKRREFNAFLRVYPPSETQHADAQRPTAGEAPAPKMRDKLRLSRELRQIQDEVLKAKVTLDECLGGELRPR
jgi:hypothetical protein